MLTLAIVGHGRMGRAVAQAAAARGHTIGAIIDIDDNAGGAGLTRERLEGVDVAVEFTAPAAAVGNIERLIEAGVPVVTGTTGWHGELPRIAKLVERKGGALLYASNFSIGVHLFLKTAAEMARRFAGRADYDGFIVEAHHARKVDAPSGTALALQHAATSADAARAFPITSIRAGAIPGTHTLTYDGPHDTIGLSHSARSREGFAEGAVAAAEWLPGRRGVFTFEDMLFGDNR
ncbi:MAG TPA: dihydrodipicolinate reductase C-terminal domain-containing protein [Gemmatimonadales bacterium]|nr:dihydrodipicolinate reductase C-terminal domain-containing protein [Gemmatimonadales bacterium]